VFGLFGLMFALFVFSGTSRLRQNGAWNEPKAVLHLMACLMGFWLQFSLYAESASDKVSASTM
jgi:hypothetical protein